MSTPLAELIVPVTGEEILEAIVEHAVRQREIVFAILEHEARRLPEWGR